MSISLSGITKNFGEKHVLSNISYNFGDKGLYLLTGISGSGKSTLLRVISALIKPDSGSIENSFGGVSYAFQDDRLFPWQRALKNASINGDRTLAADYLRRLGLEDSMDKYPNELSGGMCRRVSLARAFVYGGVPLLLDEPFRGLDNNLKDIIRDIIIEQSKERTVICATHEKDIFAHAEAVLCIENGKLK